VCGITSLHGAGGAIRLANVRARASPSSGLGKPRARISSLLSTTKAPSPPTRPLESWAGEIGSQLLVLRIDSATLQPIPHLFGPHPGPNVGVVGIGAFPPEADFVNLVIAMSA